MLNRAKQLIGMSVGALDGHLGKIVDVYFDDVEWVARYLVVETGSWLRERRVLISPIAVSSIDRRQGVVLTTLTRKQIEDSPPIDSDKPVSRQHESDYYLYYGYPDYWSGSLLWGASLHPMIPTGVAAESSEWKPDHPKEKGDSHLRSVVEVSGYHLQASDAAVGHVDDFLLDDESWALRYLIVETRNWLPGVHVVIPPSWIRRVDWSEHCVHVDVTREAIRHAREYDPSLEFSRPKEADLYRHYAREDYWH